MQYRTIYDIAARGYDGWLFGYIAAGLAAATIIVFLFFRSWKHRYVLLTISSVFTAVAFIMPYWDYTRLKKKLESDDCLKTEGAVTSYWEKKWRDKDASNKWQNYHYESFTVNSVKFGYYITGGGSAAGFTNGATVQIPIRDGMKMRVHYYDEPVITDGTVNNRILKLEVAE